MAGGVTVIVPVYGDWESLERCIVSLIKYAKTRHRVILINDCGPEADYIELQIRKLTRGKFRFKYYRNEKNLGFVKTCNRGVELARSRDDILLLNSDAELTDGALERMRKALNRADNIASVSPRSNNATVFSIPFDYKTGKVVESKESYRIYNNVKDHLPEVYETPTTHGFCMLIRRSVIDEIGLFDEIYGMGYGEENDFCMRALKNGYTHAIANKAYVFHEGSKSFSRESRDERSTNNLVILNERYPEYKELINKYILHAVAPEQELISKVARG